VRSRAVILLKSSAGVGVPGMLFGMVGVQGSAREATVHTSTWLVFHFHSDSWHSLLTVACVAIWHANCASGPA
jgi:hypothetical protein